MLPYVTVPTFFLGPFAIQPFGLLVTVGTIVSWLLVLRRAKSLGFNTDDVHSFLYWMVVSGLVGSHVFEIAFYRPWEVVENPLVLLYIWQGIASFGGFLGATLGGLAWKYVKLKSLRESGLLSFITWPVRRTTPMPLLPYADLMLAAFPILWIFGRTGCAITHDHPGIAASATNPLAVAYGPGPIVDHGFYQLTYGNTPRFDLGLLELLLTIPIALAFVLTWKRGGAKGYYVVSLCLIYAPIRFFLDYLRTSAESGGDTRYLGITPAQWSCIPLFAFGLWLWRRIRRGDASMEPTHASTT